MPPVSFNGAATSRSEVSAPAARSRGAWLGAVVRTVKSVHAKGARIFTAQEMENLERANLERALAACAGKISGETGAAQRLGLAPSTLSSRLKVLGVRRS